MLTTALTRILNVRVPVLNAPMTPQAGGKLALAVSRAGAFGMVGLNEDDSPDEIATQLAILKDQDVPFGVGLVAWVLERRPELLDLALNARPHLVSVSFGNPAPYMQRLRDAGVTVAAQVQDAASARVALLAGVDLLVAQGGEAGGHTGTIGTLPLLQLLLDLSDRPVLAAGGIATGRGLAAVLAAGAAGAWIGTPFLLADESRAAEAAKDTIIASDETQTIYTSVFDRLQDKGWTSAIRGRAIANSFAREWTGREADLLANATARKQFETATHARDYDVAHIYAGQSIGTLSRRRTAADIVEDLERQAVARLRAVTATLNA